MANQSRVLRSRDSGWPMGGEHTHTLAVRWRSGIVISNAEQNIIGSLYSVTNIKETHSGDRGASGSVRRSSLIGREGSRDMDTGLSLVSDAKFNRY